MGTGRIIVFGRLSRIQLARLDGRSNYLDSLIGFGGKNKVLLKRVFGSAIFLSAFFYLRHQARSVDELRQSIGAQYEEKREVKKSSSVSHNLLQRSVGV